MGQIAELQVDFGLGFLHDLAVENHTYLHVRSPGQV